MKTGYDKRQDVVSPRWTLRAGVWGVLLGVLLTPWIVAQAHDRKHHRSSASPVPPTVTDLSQNPLKIPDAPLVDQHGKPVRFYQDLIKDNVVAINFVYTTCSTICLPMGANFAALQKRLGERLDRDVKLISISVDPLIDTPQRLHAWGQKFHPMPGWTLLTGSKGEVDGVLKALKVFTPDKADHAPIALIGNDATQTWSRVNGLASPAMLEKLLNKVSKQGAETAALRETQRQ